MSTSREARVFVRFLATAEGGREQPVSLESGQYRPHLQVNAGEYLGVAFTRGFRLCRARNGNECVGRPSPSCDALREVEQQYKRLQQEHDLLKKLSRIGTPEDRPWGLRDFTLIDPSGVLWRIGQGIPAAD